MDARKVFSWLGIIAIGILIGKEVIAGIKKGLHFGTPKIKNPSITGSSVIFDFVVPITNNSEVSLPLDWFKGNLFYGTLPLASFTIDDTTIASKSTVEMPVKTIVPITQLASDIVSIISSGQWLESFRVTGVASSSGIEFDVNETMNLLN